MRHILGLTLLPEMAVLWVLETSICFFVFYFDLNGWPVLPWDRWLLIGASSLMAAEALLLALTLSLVAAAIGLYRPDACLEFRLLLAKTVVAATASLPAVWLVAKACHIYIGSFFGWGPAWPVRALFAWGLLLLLTRLIFATAFRAKLLVRHVIVVGAPPTAVQTIEATCGSIRRFMFRIEAIEPGSSFSPSSLPAGLWGVVFAEPFMAVDLPASVRRFDVETFWEDQLGRIDIVTAARHSNPSAEFAEAARASGVAAASRRLFDILAAILLMFLTAPLLSATALLVKVESPGPVIYRQERVGLNGRIFTLWKFRSMRHDAERLGPSWAAIGDARVTAVGRFIRRLRIDELPQLINILRGEMSLIGPRPERPHFVAKLEQVIPLYGERARVKPGLTGWAQVNYPYGASVEDARAKLSYDLYYVKHRSLVFDLFILLATVRVILFQEGSR